MEAHLRHTSKREPRCALDATEDIERLLGKMRQYFCSRDETYNKIPYDQRNRKLYHSKALTIKNLIEALTCHKRPVKMQVDFK
jgi:hypothetical protein